MKKFSLIVSAVFIIHIIPCLSVAQSQRQSPIFKYNTDFKISPSKSLLLRESLLTESASKEVQGKKSPVLAGVLSLLLPGTGQAYNGQWIKAGIQWTLLAGSIYLAVRDVNFDSSGEPLTTSSVVGISIGAATWIWSVVDVVISANSINKQRQLHKDTYLRNPKGKAGVSFHAAGSGAGICLEF